MEHAHKWKPGLPPGPYYPGMAEDYDVRYTPGGVIWHRLIRRKAEQDTKAEGAG